MNLAKIKDLIKKNGDKFILIDNEEPEVVMISFQEYERLLKETAMSDERIIPSKPPKTQTPLKISELEMDKVRETEFVLPASSESSMAPVRLEDIRLEDLPL